MKKSERLTATIEYILSQPPASAGLRLKSQRELASIFGTHESQVRKCLEVLVRKGLLVRRRGSGTFIRRIGDFPQNKADLCTLPEKSLFAGLDDHYVGHIQRARTRLHIGLWGDLQYSTSPALHKILEGISTALETNNHWLTIHTLQSRAQEFPISKFQEMIKENPCDGYLVAEFWGDHFLKAAEDRRLPVMFFAAGSVKMMHEPVVMDATAEAADRALRILAQEGYRRIGIVSLRPERLENTVYTNTMRDLGLDYHNITTASKSLGESFAAIRRMLASENRPEALYIADDTIMPAVSEAIVATGLKPGEDIAIITLSNYGLALPDGYQWSRMDFDPLHFGQILVENLLYMLQNAGARPKSISIHATWIPGQTHLKPANKS